MTTDPTITASLAAACAAHDRHRLDVLDALLDEAAPTAVRELLGAALDLCASLRAERAEREAAIGATFAKHRAEIDAATAQLAAARQVIDEERATVARLTADRDRLDTERADAVSELARACRDLTSERHRVASLESERTEWIAAAVDVGDALGGSLGPVAGTSGTIDPREWIHFAAGLADRAKKLSGRVAELDPVTPAPRPTPTPRDAVRGAMELAAESFGVSDGTFTGAGFSAAIMSAAGLSGAADGRLVRAILRGRSDVRDCGGGHYRIVQATTPQPAPADVFAGVSEDELIRLFYVVGSDGVDHGEQCPPIDASDRAGIRAVLARLRVTLVKPVDPEEVARAYHDDKESPVPEWPYAADHDINSPVAEDHEQARLRAASAMRATLTAAGIPVTPERGK